ncbi:hypothetical protein OROMI_013358 [Orobanche minor]
MAYSEERGALYHIKYHVAGGARPDFLAIATVTPPIGRILHE